MSFRRRPMDVHHMRAVAEAIGRQPNQPGLYVVYDRLSDTAAKFVRTCAALDMPSTAVGDRYTLQSLLTPEITKLLAQNYPVRLAAVVASLSRSSFQRATPKTLWHIRRAFVTSGVVGFAFSHTSGARQADDLTGLLAATPRRVRHIGVADLRASTVHFIVEPFTEGVTRKILYRASRTSERDRGLLAVEGGAELEMALSTAADIANDEIRTATANPNRTLAAVGGR